MKRFNLIMLFSLLVTACGGLSKKQAIHAGGVFRMAIEANVSTTIPRSVIDYYSEIVLNQMYEGLVSLDPESLQVRPQILNPEVLLPKSTFDISEINANSTGKISWTSINENGKLPYYIEQYRWNKWVQVGEVSGKGTEVANKYEFQVIPHSGENVLRVVQVDHSGNKRSSKEVKFTSQQKAISKGSTIVKNSINFTEENQPSSTRFEIFDVYGNIIKKGTGTTVDCSNLLKGAYYINYDNKTEKFFKN